MGTSVFGGANSEGVPCTDLPGMTLHVGNCDDTLHVVVRQEGQGEGEAIAGIHIPNEMVPALIGSMLTYSKTDPDDMIAIIRDNDHYTSGIEGGELRVAIDAARNDDLITYISGPTGEEIAAVVPVNVAAAGCGALEALWEAEVVEEIAERDDEPSIPLEHVIAELAAEDSLKGIQPSDPSAVDKDDYEDTIVVSHDIPDEQLTQTVHIVHNHAVIAYIKGVGQQRLAAIVPPAAAVVGQAALHAANAYRPVIVAPNAYLP